MVLGGMVMGEGGEIGVGCRMMVLKDRWVGIWYLLVRKERNLMIMGGGIEKDLCSLWGLIRCSRGWVRKGLGGYEGWWVMIMRWWEVWGMCF